MFPTIPELLQPPRRPGLPVLASRYGHAWIQPRPAHHDLAESRLSCFLLLGRGWLGPPRPGNPYDTLQRQQPAALIPPRLTPPWAPGHQAWRLPPISGRSAQSGTRGTRPHPIGGLPGGARPAEGTRARRRRADRPVRGDHDIRGEAHADGDQDILDAACLMLAHHRPWPTAPREQAQGQALARARSPASRDRWLEGSCGGSPLRRRHRPGSHKASS